MFLVGGIILAVITVIGFVCKWIIDAKKED